MKKLIIIAILFTIFLWLKVNINANRDSITDRTYWWNIKWPFVVWVKTKNTACTSPQIEHTYTAKNIFSKLTTRWVNWETCTITWDTIFCKKNISWWSLTKESSKIEIYWSMKDILTELSVSGSIIDLFDPTDEFIQKIDMDMKIIVDANWTIHEDWAAENSFQGMSLSLVWNWNTIEYSDPTECSSDPCPVWETCPSLQNPPPLPPEIPFPIIDNLWEFNNLTIKWCSEETVSWIDSYVCYSTWAINIEASLNQLREYWQQWNTQTVWINSIDISINDWLNQNPWSIWSIVNNQSTISSINTPKLINIKHHSLNKANKYTITFQWKYNWSIATKIKELKLIIIPNNNFRTYRDYIENIDIWYTDDITTSTSVVHKNIYNVFKHRIEEYSKKDSEINKSPVMNEYWLSTLVTEIKKLYSNKIDDWNWNFKEYNSLDDNYDSTIPYAIENKERLEAFWKITEQEKIDLFNSLTEDIQRKIYLNLTRADILNKYNLINHNWVYADNISSINIKKLIVDSFWNLVIPTNITNMDINNLILQNTIKLDPITPKTTSSLTASGFNFNNSFIEFNLNSKAPWKTNLKFKVKIPQHNEDTSLTTNSSLSEVETKADPDNDEVWNDKKINFKKPFTWKLRAMAWATEIKATIWTMTDYNLKLIQKSPNPLTYTSWSVDISKSKTKLTENGHTWEDYSVTWTWFDNTTLDSWLSFKWRINANWGYLDWVNIKLEDQIIEYKMWNNLVRYYLTSWDDWDNMDSVTLSWETLDTLWLTVVWTLQWQWKANLTGQDENFSALQKANLKKLVRKNAYNLINNINPWVTNNIKYVEWNFTLNTDPNWAYSTLIVKNWNLSITTDIKSTLGIIVLKDNYSIDTDSQNWGMWNVLIWKDVSYLNTIIYSDWALFSLDPNKSYTTYQSDSSQRTSDLQKQLVIFWSIFTRNTVWWSILAGTSEYQLPWGKTTTDYDKSFIYDLNYIRRWNNWWDTGDIDWNWVPDDWDWNQYNKWFNDPLVVIYNSKIATNPPKWFEQ